MLRILLTQSIVGYIAEGRRKKEEGRRKKEEGKILRCLSFKLLICPRPFLRLL
ncbi:MAG: hypothetical protein F6K39_41485 [Okeania sp. SIO3B3]|nr:hypothetical protein [Okeania sp. SIO3B3]